MRRHVSSITFSLCLIILSSITSCSNRSNFSLDQSLAKRNVELFQDVVSPLLQAKCVQCHGNEKQKGKLRLDLPEFITKGGKGGKTVIPNNSNDSELIYHVQLPLDDEDHMPPKEEEQLTKQEIDLLIWWIDSGAKFEGLIDTLLTKEQLANLKPQQNIQQASLLTAIKVSAPDQSVVQKLIDEGVAVTPIEHGSNFLSVNFISVPNKAESLLKELSSIKENIVSLKLSGCSVNDSSLSSLKDFNNLLQLSLDRTPISDQTLSIISNLKNLRYLNLVGTLVTASGIEKLTSLKALEKLYLYQTKISETEQTKLKSLFVHVDLNFGEYQVQTLEWDTTVSKGTRPKN